MKPEILFDDDGGMDPQNAPYFRMWQDRYGPLGDSYYLYMEFSPRYFEKLKNELEAAGYEITFVGSGFYCWYSPPVGHFAINNSLTDESFVFFAM